MKKLYIFTLPFCKSCKLLIEELEKLSIPFLTISVPDNQEIWNDIKKQLRVKKLNCPTIFFQESDHEGYIYIPNRDYETIDQAIKIIQSNIEI